MISLFWGFPTASTGLGQITCSLFSLLAKFTAQGTRKHFLKNRKCLLIVSPGGQIVADTSFKGSNPGQEAEGLKSQLSLCTPGEVSRMQMRVVWPPFNN